MEQGWTSESIGRMLYGTSMALLAVTSSFGYFTFLCAIWNRKSLQKRSTLLMSLCVSDLGMVFGHMVTTSFYALFFTEWQLGELGCKVNAFLGMGCAFTSFGNMTLLAYDTYLKEIKSDRHCLNYGFYITGVWILGLATGFLPFMGIGTYGCGLELQCFVDHTSTGSVNLALISFLLVVWMGLPLFVIAKYYKKLRAETGKGLMLKLVPCQMLICWGPYSVASFLIVLGFHGVQLEIFGSMCNVFAKIYFATNPYIYIANDKELRSACREVWFQKSKKNK